MVGFYFRKPPLPNANKLCWTFGRQERHDLAKTASAFWLLANVIDGVNPLSCLTLTGGPNSKETVYLYKVKPRRGFPITAGFMRILLICSSSSHQGFFTTVLIASYLNTYPAELKPLEFWF